MYKIANIMFAFYNNKNMLKFLINFFTYLEKHQGFWKLRSTPSVKVEPQF